MVQALGEPFGATAPDAPSPNDEGGSSLSPTRKQGWKPSPRPHARIARDRTREARESDRRVLWAVGAKLATDRTVRRRSQ